MTNRAREIVNGKGKEFVESGRGWGSAACLGRLFSALHPTSDRDVSHKLYLKRNFFGATNADKWTLASEQEKQKGTTVRFL